MGMAEIRHTRLVYLQVWCMLQDPIEAMRRAGVVDKRWTCTARLVVTAMSYSTDSNPKCRLYMVV